MPSQSARSWALASAVDRPTMRTLRPVWLLMYLFMRKGEVKGMQNVEALGRRVGREGCRGQRSRQVPVTDKGYGN